jgi:hypothetical protein
MNEEDKKSFLKDFEQSDISKKVDMWFFALDQQGLWEEIIEEMATIAQDRFMGKKATTVKE